MRRLLGRSALACVSKDKRCVVKNTPSKTHKYCKPDSVKPASNPTAWEDFERNKALVPTIPCNAP